MVTPTIHLTCFKTSAISCGLPVSDAWEKQSQRSKQGWTRLGGSLPWLLEIQSNRKKLESWIGQVDM